MGEMFARTYLTEVRMQNFICEPFDDLKLLYDCLSDTTIDQAASQVRSAAP